MTAVPGPKGRSESQPIPSPPTLSKPQTAKRDVQALLALPVKFVLSGNTILIESTPAIFQQLLRKAQTTQTRRASKNNCQNTPSLSQESTAIHDSSRTSSDSDSSNSASPSTAPTSPPTSAVHSENESFDKEDIPLFEPTPSRESSPKKRKWDNDDSDVKRVKSNDGQALRNGLTEEAVDAPKDNTLESQSLKAEPVVEPSHKSIENPDIKPEVVDKDAPSPESPKSTPSPNKRKAVVTLEEPASQRVKITAKDKPHKVEAKDTKNTPEATTATPPKVIKGVDGVVKKKEKPVKRRVLGIRNPHIMCYRNSVLQLLGSCDIFVQELTKHRQGGTCKVKGTCVACCLAIFFTKHFREADQPITLNPAMRFINATKKGETFTLLAIMLLMLSSSA